MLASTRWILGVVIAIGIALAVVVVRPNVQERRVISRLLETEVYIYLESYPSTGHNDDSRWWDPVFGYSDPIVGLTLPDDASAYLVASNLHCFDSVRTIHAEDGVSDDAVGLLAETFATKAQPLEGFNCYAQIERQQTLDKVLSVDAVAILIGRPPIEQPDLKVVAESQHLEDFWIVEDVLAGREQLTDGANRSRYDARDIRCVLEAPRLKSLVLIGVDISEEFAAELAASQGVAITLSNCEVSEGIAKQLQEALGESRLTIREYEE